MAAWGMDPVNAHDALVDFSARRGEAALRLAMHAAPAERFRADLLHLLRLNFVPDLGSTPAIESDVLLAPFCHELGGGYYRFDPEIRSQLLDLLLAEYPETPEPRVRRVAKFFAAWVEDAGRALKKHVDPVSREYLALLNWVALAYTQPEAAAGQLAAALNGAIDRSDALVRLQVSSVISSLALPLVSHQRLLAYAAGVEALESGREADAARLLAHVEGLEIAPGIKAHAIDELIPGTRGGSHPAVADAPAPETPIPDTQGPTVLVVVEGALQEIEQWRPAFAAQGFSLEPISPSEFTEAPFESFDVFARQRNCAFILALEDFMASAFYSRTVAAHAAALFGGWDRTVFLPRSEPVMDLFAACKWIVWMDPQDSRSKAEQAAEMASTVRAMFSLSDEEVEERLRAQVALFEGVFGPDSGDLATSRLEFASVLARRNNFEQALSLNRSVMESFQKLDQLAGPLGIRARQQAGACLYGLGRLEEALEFRRAILDTLTELRSEEDEETVSAMLDLAESLGSLQQDEEARPLARRALSDATRLWGEKHPLSVRAALLVGLLESERAWVVEVLNSELDPDLAGLLYLRLAREGLRVHLLKSSDPFDVNRTGAVVAILISRENIGSFTLQAQAEVARSRRIPIVPIAIDAIAYPEFAMLFGPDIPLLHAKSLTIEELARRVHDAVRSASQPVSPPPPQDRKVYVSSTWAIQYTAAARRAIKRLGMTVYPSDLVKTYPRDEPLEECEIFVGVYDNLYGYIPPDAKFPLEELEYRRALARGIPILIFIRRDKPRLTSESGSGDSRGREFHEMLQREQIVQWFDTERDLETLILSALTNQAVNLTARPIERLLAGLGRKAQCEAFDESFFGWSGMVFPSMLSLPCTEDDEPQLASQSLLNAAASRFTGKVVHGFTNEWPTTIGAIAENHHVRRASMILESIKEDEILFVDHFIPADDGRQVEDTFRRYLLFWEGDERSRNGRVILLFLLIGAAAGTVAQEMSAVASSMKHEVTILPPLEPITLEDIISWTSSKDMQEARSQDALQQILQTARIWFSDRSSMRMRELRPRLESMLQRSESGTAEVSF
jgi:tetratricopeptide (TPR) repeat protein